MTVAASLSQIQNLLHGATLKDKPELRDTLDRALTGCWVVYQCLDEEVRDLAQKVDVNDLRKRDRARFLTKEANFKELLQQIRGQQSALGLLIQGLQMESLTDMHKLIVDNTRKLDQIAKRSKTLREKHPNIKVPESVINKDNIDDAQTLLGDAELSFDDEIVNSKAYQTAMAQATTKVYAESKEETKIADQNIISPETVQDIDIDDQNLVDGEAADVKSLMIQVDNAIVSHDNDAPPPYEKEREDVHSDTLDDLEKSLLPFMPPVPLTPRPSVVITESQPDGKSHQTPTIATSESFTSTPVVPLDDEPQEERRTFATADEDQEDEEPPPLPPRRPSPLLLAPSKPDSTPDLKTASSWEDIFSPLSTTSSLSLTDPSTMANATPQSSPPFRKPSPFLIKKISNLSLRTPVEENTQATAITYAGCDEVWASILSNEEKYIERMHKFSTTFYDGIFNSWPRLEKHLEAITLGKKLVSLHQQYILDVVKEQITQNPTAVCDPRLFITWARKSYRVLKEYSQRYPHALYALRLTQSRDKKFSPYVETLGLSSTNFGKSWEDYLVLPIMQLDAYVTKVESLIQLFPSNSDPSSIKEESRLKATLDMLQKLRGQCSDLVDRSTKHEEVQSLFRRIHTADTALVDVLDLSAPDRQILHQGSLAMKLKGNGSWRIIQVVLLDNYLFWGKIKPSNTWKNQELRGDIISLVEPVSPKSAALLSVTLANERSPFQSRTLGSDYL